MTTSSLRNRVFAGTSSGLIAQGVIFAVRMAAGVALARLLSRDDFGIFAIATILFELSNIVQGMGLRMAVVQKDISDRDVLNTAFTLQLALAGLLFVLLVTVGAPLWGAFYRNQHVASVVRVECLLLLFNAISFLPQTALQVSMRFGLLNAARALQMVVSMVVAVALAFVLRNFWAIVIGHLAGGLLSTIFLLVRSKTYPRICFDRTIAGELLRFGKHILFLNLLVFAGHQMDKAFAGRLLSLEDVGIYYQAQTWGLFVVVNMVNAVQNVFFTAYCKRKEEPTRIRQGYLHSVFIVSLMVIPGCFGLFLVAPDFVQSLLGETWLPAIRPMQAFALLAILRVLCSLTAPIIPAMGRPDVSLRITIVTRSILFVSLFICCSLWGIMGAVLAVGLDYLLTLIILMFVMRRFINLRCGAIARAVAPAVALSLSMVPVWWLLQPLSNGLYRCLLTAAGSALVYGVLCALTYRIFTLRRLHQFVLHGIPSDDPEPYPASGSPHE